MKDEDRGLAGRGDFPSHSPWGQQPPSLFRPVMESKLAWWTKCGWILAETQMPSLKVKAASILGHGPRITSQGH